MRPTVGKFWMPRTPRDFRVERRVGRCVVGSEAQRPARGAAVVTRGSTECA